ncbi:MAG: hypothetical protein JZU65_15450 [Chlorobium sp.]|nr:hypothetical protein [Chlorobium sp.]
MLTINKLLERIIEYNDLPKFQVERAISPILSFYIGRILSKNNEELELVSPEYPLKNDNNQSTNIDYLIINKTKNCILLVELKTNFRASTKSVLEHQSKYEEIIEKIYKNTAAFLVEDIEKIYSGTNEKEKYHYLKEQAKRVNKDIRHGEIVYLVPKTIKSKIIHDRPELKYTSLVAFDEIITSGHDDEVYDELVKALLMLK